MRLATYRTGVICVVGREALGWRGGGSISWYQCQQQEQKQ